MLFVHFLIIPMKNLLFYLIFFKFGVLFLFLAINHNVIYKIKILFFKKLQKGGK